MYELSLFSGAGGGSLAAKCLLGWTCIGYVEKDD
jgi:site-specific DNA-cytosine methylase